MSIYDYNFQNIKNEDISMSDYKGKVMLIVNTASECGLTEQYEGLEDLYEAFKSDGFIILGFPCNQFGGQEPGSDSDIQKFCKLKFGIKFPVFKKIDVNGKNTHPLYKYLKSEARGFLGSEMIKWNFTKFLVDRDGSVLKRFSPKDTPAKIKIELEKMLKA